jgi:hypothetical protein
MEQGTPNQGVELTTLGHRFMLHLARYLTGAGHPNDPSYENLVSAEKREAALKDKAFRARQFLYQMTGTTFLHSVPSDLRVCTWLSFVDDTLNPISRFTTRDHPSPDHLMRLRTGRYLGTIPIRMMF